MSTPNDGGPAREKTLRDEIAVAALQAVLANQELLVRIDLESSQSTRHAVATYAYALADAMLAAREKGQP